VVFGDFDEVFGTLETRMRDRAEGENAFEALREWIGELVASGGHKEDDREWLRHCLVRDNDALAAHERHIMGRFETLIAQNVAVDLGSAPDDLQPKLIAAAAVAALMALSGDERDGVRGRKRHGTDEADLARLDEAFLFLRGGIAALQEVRGTAPQAK
jgi:hypothetical protein